MKQQLLLAFFILFTIQSFAQDYKWSVEANYPISIGDDLGNDSPGIADLGIKYRFLDLNVVKIGVGLNVGVFHGNVRSFDGYGDEPDSFDFNETNWLFQPKIFSEFQIPGMSKLKPSVGIGYTIIRDHSKGRIDESFFDSSFNDGGLNLNIGLSYDISNRFFVQAQYDYIRTKNTYTFEGNSAVVKENLGFLKFGLGFRF